MKDQLKFDYAAHSWALTRELPWNRLRYELTHHFIRKHLKEPILNMLNIGCGEGSESFLFGEDSIEMTLADISGKMLQKARELAEKKQKSNKITYIQSPVASLGSKLAERYQLILYHNVIEYVEEPLESLRQIHNWLSPDGLFSIRYLNRYSNVYAPAVFENNLELSTEYLGSPCYNSSFGTRIQTYTGEQIADMLEQAGFSVEGHYGLISICNLIADNEKKHEAPFYEKLKQLEIKMATRFPYHHVARFGHFLCRRSDDQRK